MKSAFKPWYYWLHGTFFRSILVFAYSIYSLVSKKGSKNAPQTKRTWTPDMFPYQTTTFFLPKEVPKCPYAMKPSACTAFWMEEVQCEAPRVSFDEIIYNRQLFVYLIRRMDKNFFAFLYIWAVLTLFSHNQTHSLPSLPPIRTAIGRRQLSKTTTTAPRSI